MIVFANHVLLEMSLFGQFLSLFIVYAKSFTPRILELPPKSLFF